MASLLKQANAIGRHYKKHIGKFLPPNDKNVMSNPLNERAINSPRDSYRKTKKRHTGSKMIGEV